MPTFARSPRYPFALALARSAALERLAAAALQTAGSALARERARIADTAAALMSVQRHRPGEASGLYALFDSEGASERTTAAAAARVESARAAFHRARIRREALSRHRSRFVAGWRAGLARSEAALLDETNAQRRSPV